MIFDESKYRKYANQFWDDLNSTFRQYKGQFGYLPIVFVEPPTKKGMKYINGVTEIHINEKKQVYSCYPIVFIHPETTDTQLQQTIRHEIIHYYLALHYYNHEDKSALFALVCGLFDGGAYEPLSNKGQIIYDSAKTYLEQTYELYVRSEENSPKKDLLAMQLSMMLNEIDNAEHNQDSKAKSLESSLSLLLKVSKSLFSRE